MTDQSHTPETFAYRAQTRDGQEISGTIDARDSDDARRRLISLQLQNVQLQPATHAPRAVGKASAALRGEDFVVFNQQLAQLAGAGLPVEQGLRLVAREMRRGSMRQTLDLVAAELESGKTLPQAVAAYRDKFPPLYSQLIDAGIRSGNLSGILLNLGDHLTLIRRMQAILWQTLSYPIIVLVAFFAVLYFILVELVPKWEPMITGFAGTRFWVRLHGNYTPQIFQLPFSTRALFAVSDVVSAVPVAVVGAVAAVVVIGAILILRAAGRNEGLTERLMLPLPLVGIVLRRNLVSRWCHAVALAVESGLDLPAAIKLADDATASPILRADGAALIAALSAGQPISTPLPGKILPGTVVAAMEASAQRGDLNLTLRALSQMYQQQAELRLGAIQAILTPLLLLLVGLFVGALMVALFTPLLALLNMI
jgi:type II secretory pathway component PulF